MEVKVKHLIHGTFNLFRRNETHIYLVKVIDSSGNHLGELKYTTPQNIQQRSGFVFYL